MKRTLIVNCVNINAYEGLFDDRLIFICELMGHIARPHTTALKFAFKLLYLRAKNISQLSVILKIILVLIPTK